ncbi:MAG: FHA domain-containing protein [Verrucomicrobia bacterium]|nr:FHA domain-containing protein [Verrucomicrobiota bacterium]MCH8511462.1 FHA domain-containing protein [Kiritimatiellia bacterium]
MNAVPPHFIIEEGPERGRELVIPPDGARIGRATENDLSIADAAMSRFQCRIYFRDGFLHVMDLGSTNETLVNDAPVSDQVLRKGDEILIGESMLRVVNDELDGKIPAPVLPEKSEKSEDADKKIVPENAEGQEAGEKSEKDAEPAPIIFLPDAEDEEPEPAPIPEPAPASKATRPPESKSGSKADGNSESPPPRPASTPPASMNEDGVDLGLGRKFAGSHDENGSQSKTNYLLITLVTILMVMVVGMVYLLMSQQEAPAVDTGSEEDTVQVYYEKIRAGEGNIFRYAVEISPKGMVYAEIHDLANQLRITREHEMSQEAYRQLRNQLLNRQDTFERLRDEYEGTSVDMHESYEMTLIFGRDVKRVRVANQLEPDAFREVRDQVEAFVDNELDLDLISQPPEVLRREANRAWENAQRLYAERDVKNSNLWEATQQLRQVTWLLDNIEPKPDYYRDAVRLQQEWRADLEKRVTDFRFEAARQQQLGNFERAADIYRQVLATFPERSHSLYIQSYNNLIQIEQRLNR